MTFKSPQGPDTVYEGNYSDVLTMRLEIKSTGKIKKKLG